MATNPTSIPKVQTTDRNINQLQSNILPPLNKLLQNEVVNNNFLSSIDLKTGSNTVNHLLGRELIGWVITRKRSAAQIYDDQDNNDDAVTNLILVSDSDVTVDLMVF